MLAGVTLATATAAFAPIAIRVIGGGTDSPSVDVLRVLAVALAFTFPLALWSYLLLALGQVRALTISGTIAATSAFALALGLVSEHGAIGRSGCDAGRGGHSGRWRSSLSITRVDGGHVPRPSRFLRLFLAAIPAAVIVWLTRDAGQFAPLAAIPAFVLAAVALRAVPPELWDIARRSRAVSGDRPVSVAAVVVAWRAGELAGACLDRLAEVAPAARRVLVDNEAGEETGAGVPDGTTVLSAWATTSASRAARTRASRGRSPMEPSTPWS